MNKIFKRILFVGVPFGITVGLYVSILNNILYGIITGIIAGIVFGTGLYLFVLYQQVRFRRKQSEITGDKCVVMNGAANHFINKESAGGWLYLTKDKIIFKSHNLNIQNHQLTICLNQIAAVDKCFTLWIVPNGMKITTAR